MINDDNKRIVIAYVLDCLRIMDAVARRDDATASWYFARPFGEWRCRSASAGGSRLEVQTTSLVGPSPAKA